MSDMAKKNKKKKEKIIYVDDGRTVADMSGVSGRKSAPKSGRQSGGLKDQFRTFRDAQRAMFLPMIATLAIIALAFLIVYILL